MYEKKITSPFSYEYRSILIEIADFLDIHKNIKEIEIEHPCLGKIRIVRQELTD